MPELEARSCSERSYSPLPGWKRKVSRGRGPRSPLARGAAELRTLLLRRKHGKTRVIWRGGSSLPGVKILTTPVKGSFHVDIPGQSSTCLGNITALEE